MPGRPTNQYWVFLLLGVGYVVLGVSGFVFGGRSVGIVLLVFGGLVILVGVGWYLGFNRFFRSK